MHPDTEISLKKLRQFEEEVRTAKARIKLIKNGCLHYDHSVEYRETRAFEYTPFRVCVVCGISLPGITDQECRELYMAHQDIMQETSTPEEIEKNFRGFNI